MQECPPCRIRSAARKILQTVFRSLGLRAVSLDRLGIDVLLDVQRTQAEFLVVFDVGANIGAMTRDYLRAFPKAMIHAFEPIAENFQELRQLVKTGRVFCHQVALADAPGERAMFISTTPTHHSLITASADGRKQDVTVTTIDEFCRQRCISRINFLKVDAEGAELLVLRGASGMLAAGRIDFVFVEVGFESGRREVPMWEVDSFLQAHGHRVFGIYDQVPEWDGKAALHYVNVCYARSGLLLSN
jgi:FkbM family methyltransferase